MQHTNRAAQIRWRMCESAYRKYDVCSQPLKRLFAGFTFFFFLLFKLIRSSFSSVSSRNSLVSFRHTHTLISQIASTCTRTHTITSVQRFAVAAVFFYSSGAYLYIIIALLRVILASTRRDSLSASVFARHSGTRFIFISLLHIFHLS